MIREIIRLKQQGCSHQRISQVTGRSRPTVIKYVQVIETCGLEPCELLELSDYELHRLIEVPGGTAPDEGNKIYIELTAFFGYAERELRKTGVTRKLLWQEYLDKHPDGLRYSRFCYHFSEWLKKEEGYMPVDHKPGDKLYIDFSGKKFRVVDPGTGELQEKECFVATLGASQYTYVQACESQRTGDFLEAIENAFHFFGGVPACVVIDNLKSGVKKASKYEPKINDLLAELAAHYDTVIMPARPYKPKDKPLVEGAVNIVYKRIFARLRNRELFSTEQLNQAIAPLLSDYNRVRFQEKNFSREEAFLKAEKQALKPLASMRYELKEYKEAKVQKNCHVFVSSDRVYYSVPHAYQGKQVKVVLSRRNVEIYHDYKRIAFHLRCRLPHRYVTVDQHMPSNHLHVRRMEPEKLIERARKIGPATACYLQHVLNANSYPEQGYKSCDGILAQVHKAGKERLENACKRALEYQVYNYHTIKNILEKGLDRQQASAQTMLRIPFHENIRGKDYYR